LIQADYQEIIPRATGLWVFFVFAYQYYRSRIKYPLRFRSNALANCNWVWHYYHDTYLKYWELAKKTERIEV